MSVPFKPVTRVALHWPARFVIKAARTTAKGLTTTAARGGITRFRP